MVGDELYEGLFNVPSYNPEPRTILVYTDPTVAVHFPRLGKGVQRPQAQYI